MVSTAKVKDAINQSSPVSEAHRKKLFKLIENTYQNNTNSDYTEKIEELDKNFNYISNRNHYWTYPEQSMLYGTPLYEASSPSQKLALNHLHWFGMYGVTADSETETTAYNQITADVFFTSGYETLARMLKLETEQEHFHIHAFHRISYKTMKALLGKDAFKVPLKVKGRLDQVNNQGWAEQLMPASLLKFIAKRMLSSKKQYYAQYLREAEQTNNKLIPASTKGLIGRGLAPESVQQFFAFNWGGSPFLACQYYAVRIMANMALKNTEHNVVKYFRQLHKKGEFIPAPTAISYYHFLDESFHTTTSQLIARDLYKNFPKPTAYEKLVANLAIYMMQRGILSGLSAVSPDRYYADDCSLMYFVYKILQSPLFEMPPQEALHWVEKCFCHEHEGFQITAKYHQRLRADCCRFYQSFEYLWPINREMRLMASEGMIDKAIQSNRKTFQQFSQAVA